MGIAIRSATLADSEPLAGLMTELGYPTSSRQMEQRLTFILGDVSYRTFVACDGDAIVGIVGTRIGPMYEIDDPYGQIMALVVSETNRRQGVGVRLVEAAESHFIERGAALSIVTSANRRADAHAFYERHGYAFDGRRYKKTLAPATSEAP
jgi:ribosomal protein S18 acetylase RimI-like enzyme